MESNLNDRQERFCEEYLIDCNATKAATRAGYSEETAGSQGHDLLKKPEIVDRISQLQRERSERTQITADRVLLELAKIGFSDIKDFLDAGNTIKDLSDMPSDKTSIVSSIKVKKRTMNLDSGETMEQTETEFRLHDKLSALDKIGKHIGLYEKDNGQKGKNAATVVILPHNPRDLHAEPNQD